MGRRTRWVTGVIFDIMGIGVIAVGVDHWSRAAALIFLGVAALIVAWLVDPKGPQ